LRKVLAGLLIALGLGFCAFGFSSLADAANFGAVTVTFKILSTQELTITGAAVDFGDVAPGTTAGPETVTVNVKSNSKYDLSYTATNFISGGNTVDVECLSYNETPFSESGTLAEDADPTDGRDYIYQYRLDVEWTDVPADGYTGTVTYTASPTP